MRVKFLILGGGPSGLAFAARLKQQGESSFLILEKESEVGGLCRSVDVDGSPLDIGGGHFLDTRRRKVLDFVLGFLPENEWNKFDRVSKIQTENGIELDYPYEANIWQLPIEEQVEHLLSIANAGSNKGENLPEKFSDWITWKLGDVVANKYLLPYNSKIFADVALNELGTYWLYKLPNVSFEDTLRSCLYHKPYGSLPAHAQFYYPKQYGYGELFKRMGQYIGDKKILLGYRVETLDSSSRTVNSEISADFIVNTIPWPELLVNSALPFEVRHIIEQLKFSSIDITYRQEVIRTDSHWTYYPDMTLAFHRKLFRENFLQDSRGCWEETNSLRRRPGDAPTYVNQYAYPLNTINKPALISKVIEWAGSQSIIALGRWGKWEHMNSDVAIEEAMMLAETLTR